MDADLVKWAMTQSPLAVVLLIGAYWWRSDMARIMAKDAEKVSILTDLVGDCRGAIAANTAQTQEMDRTLNRVIAALPKEGR